MVTAFAKFLGTSGLIPFKRASSYAISCSGRKAEKIRGRETVKIRGRKTVKFRGRRREREEKRETERGKEGEKEGVAERETRVIEGKERRYEGKTQSCVMRGGIYEEHVAKQRCESVVWCSAYL